MQRTGGVSRYSLRVLARLQPLSGQRFYQRSQEAEEVLAAPKEASGSKGRLLQGRLSPLSGRPVAPRFLQEVRHFSTEDDEFRRQLGRQLKELRQALHGDQPPTRSEAEKAGRRSRRVEAETEEAERPQQSEELERRPRARESKTKQRSQRAVESEKADRPGSQRSLKPVRGAAEEAEESQRSEEAERKPADQRAQRTAESEEARRGSRRSSRTVRSESEESDESEESERQPIARNYEISQSAEEQRDPRRSSRTVRSESQEVEASEEAEESEDSEETEELERRALAKDPNVIEGAYWTGEGKRLEIRFPKRRRVPSGYITGDSEEVLKLEDEPTNPPKAPRSQTTAEDLKDE